MTEEWPALAAAARAERSHQPGDINTAIMELRLALAEVTGGGPVRARMLIGLADLQKLLATITGDHGSATDALGSATEAVRAATGPDEVRAATYVLVATCSLMAYLKQRQGPFRDAEAALREALAEAAPDDWAVRTALTTGIGAALGMLASGQHDGALLARSRELIACAARILPGQMETGTWYATAKSLSGWATMHAVYGPDADLKPLALDLIDRMEHVLRTRPELAEELFGSPGDPGDPEAPKRVSEAETLRRARLLLRPERRPAEAPAQRALREAPDAREAMAGTRFDAVVYLIPPAETPVPGAGPSAGQTAQALLVRPAPEEPETLPLPGLTSAEMAPLTEYADALEAALAAFDPGAGPAEGFRGGPRGPEWSDALDRLGRWTHERITGPLTDHVRRWNLGRLPHLALIPLGALALVPYAAAWTEDAGTGGRRYALEDLVLSYGVSSRLLTEVSRRPRLGLSRRVVLVCDPTGQFPMTRRAMKAISGRQYPAAEMYGLKSAPDGAATTAALLSALPGRDRQGASLLQLSTHATAAPEPRLRTRDGWLTLADILDQARDRPPAAPGGLVIANACLTDSVSRNDSVARNDSASRNDSVARNDSAGTASDESLTLAAAFLTAGATAVIGARWPVDDDITAVLSHRLHHHLHLGCPPAQALRQAQLDLLRPGDEMRATLDPHLAAIDDSRLAHPASWAGQAHYGT